MTETLNWLIGAGLFSLVIGLVYREFEAWRGRRRELKGLLHLLDLEVSHNQQQLSTFKTHPESIVTPIGHLVRTDNWDSNKARIAQLLKDKDHFRTVAAFYSNLDNVMLPVIQLEQASDPTKQEFVSKLLPDMQRQACVTRGIIHKYIPPPAEEFGLPFELSEGPQKPER